MSHSHHPTRKRELRQKRLGPAGISGASCGRFLEPAARLWLSVWLSAAAAIETVLIGIAAILLLSGDGAKNTETITNGAEIACSKQPWRLVRCHFGDPQSRIEDANINQRFDLKTISPSSLGRIVCRRSRVKTENRTDVAPESVVARTESAVP